ncbi:hypothetical protein [Pseudomonas entomophila]|uniref:hypothetical protein n=1 Tax=Pseudomonas entomophila TaxID=312306 RepID=UPI003EB8070B
MRIRGQIGEWPVDLTIELEPQEWASLGQQIQQEEGREPPQASPVHKSPGQDDAVWKAACDVLRQAGQMTGPALLDSLEGLTGSASAGKRLLVRLRHNMNVRVQAGKDAPVYHWEDTA